MVTIHTPDNRHLEAEVLEIDGDTALIEVYGATQGLDIAHTTVSFVDAVKKVPLSPDIVGRIFNDLVNLDGRRCSTRETHADHRCAINPARPTRFH
jgi:V/A-type H+-transporting ATPase subunit B